MPFLTNYKSRLLTLLVFVIISQLAFGLFSPRYTKPFFENRMFSTTGIFFDTADLHKLNEGAHWFGQTMIGWTKFPNFKSDLIRSAGLPDATDVNLRMQERQNLILTLTTNDKIESGQLVKAKDFLQSKLDEYNKNTNTKFILTNVDYDITKIQRSYVMGAFFVFILSIFATGAYLLVKKELFPPRLRL